MLLPQETDRLENGSAQRVVRASPRVRSLDRKDLPSPCSFYDCAAVASWKQAASDAAVSVFFPLTVFTLHSCSTTQFAQAGDPLASKSPIIRRYSRHKYS